MKKILTLVLVSALGGIMTLSAYKLWIEDDNAQQLAETKQEQPLFVPVGNTTTTYIPTDTPDFISAAQKTVDAVVHVKNTAIVSRPNSLQDLFYGRSSKRAQVGTGSGVIISSDGHIITNNHVIAGATDIGITLNNNKTYNAELVGTDPKTDIALLKIDTDEDLPHVTFGDSDQAQIGEWVLAVGNPFNLTSTVTAGIISAKARDLSGLSDNVQSFIQTDAAVNPGNSGGALVNANGELIGINTAITSQTGSYVGYSFAVPSNIARKIVSDIMEFGSVQNVMLGVSGNSLNGQFAKLKDLSETEGFYVDSVEEDSGAEKAGIQSGDIIKKLDQIKINKFSDLSGYLKTKQPGDVINVTLLRNGYDKILPVTLVKNEIQIVPFIGLVKPASEKDLRRLKAEHGVKLSKLTNNERLNRYWRDNNIEEGALIQAINGKKVNTVEDVKRILNARGEYEPISFEIINKYGEKDRFRFGD